MVKIENEELNNTPSNEPDGGGNGGILALAEAVLNEPDKAHLSLEETAEELLALASEASLSSPINREIIQTPFETENTIRNKGVDYVSVSAVSAQIPNTTSPSNSNTGKHVCSNCAATSTPFWRKYSDGLYYCNACGLYLRTHNSMRPLSLSKNRESRRSKTRPELCGNCGATDTPMWRKTEDGMVVCNACGLYHKLHGQHRRSGSKRITASEIKDTLSTRKPVRNNNFTLVKENSHIASKSSTNSGTNPAAKYSLDNQYHHKFDPNRIANSSQQQSLVVESSILSPVLPVVEFQPVDARKLAYWNCPQGRTPLLAPKIPQDQYANSKNSNQKDNQPASSTPSPFMATTTSMPPILTSFINSLATTSPDNLTVEQVEHPLQPLLTSIVSQKLREQRSKHHRKSSSPILQAISTNANNIPIPMQIYHHQQQQQQQNDFNQLTEFIQNQQQAIYNQQIIQQAIYNHANENDDYSYNSEYADSTGYADYPHDGHYQHRQNFNDQYVMRPNNLQYSHHENIQNKNIQLLPQIHLSQMPQIQDNQQPQQQQTKNGVYFAEQFHEPPLRQLSPFSGIKFDKNLIDLVNMQFWQDNNNGTNPNQDQDQENSSDQNNNPF